MSKAGVPMRIHAPHTMYRLFDADNTLIYVGCTLDLEGRMKFHQQQAWWFPQYVSMTTESYPSRDEAHKAEMKAISAENPRWNIMHRSYNSGSWVEQNYRDYIKAIENQEGHQTSHRLSRLNKAKRVFARYLSESQSKAA